MAKSRRKTEEAVTHAQRRSSKMVTGLAANVTDGEIARRAYDLYLARGCEHRHDVDDWLKAERELQDAVSSTAA